AAAVIMYSATTMLRSALKDGKQPVQAANPPEVPAAAPAAEPVKEAPVATAAETKPQTTRRQILQALGIGLLAGPLSGFVGVGGGFLMIPLFVSLLHFDMRTAAGTSLLGVFCLATPAAISQMIMGNVSYLVGIPVAIGSILGTAIGKRIAKRMSDRGLKIMFSVLLGVAAILLVVNEL
ncbi:MAG: sulfite exporter TauE/SafE family protein, partial [Eggerthellaceae bacterium]|nr:sulfite exporter TauE/SafE family protein [Eggerthellaceae bacterium]